MKVVKKHKSKLLDKMTYATGILLPLLTLPQAYNVLIKNETAGVSMVTWAFYLFASFLFATFGIIHKEKLLITTYVPFTVIEAAIVIGLLRN